MIEAILIAHFAGFYPDQRMVMPAKVCQEIIEHIVAGHQTKMLMSDGESTPPIISATCEIVPCEGGPL